jgi:hypothetical protein
MKDPQSKTEAANIKINQLLDGDNEQDSIDVDPLINNNNISLVLEQDKGRDTGSLPQSDR